MATPRASRARGQHSQARRFVPRLERCEDRLPPGQIFALFTDPLDTPFGAQADTSAFTHDAPAALVSDTENPQTARPASPKPLSGLAVEDGAQPGPAGATPRAASPVALSQPAAPAEFLSQIVASLGAQDLTQDPAAAASSQTTLTGTVEAFAGTGRDGQSHLHDVYLNAGDQRVRLLGQEAEHLDNGAVVTARGTVGANGLTVAPEGITVVEPSPLLPPNGDEGGPGIAAVRSVLVINMNFQNNTSQPWNPTTQANQWNGSFNNWMNEGSYGQTQIAVTTTPWLTIGSNSSPCNYSTWSSQAQSLARGQGYEPNNYNHVVLAFPNTGACGWSGLGQAPGRITWLNGVGTNRGVALHELGHNLGLLHGQSRTCNQGPLDGTCTVSEYGDYADTMGGATVNAHFHASYRQYVGWIPSADRVVVTPAQGIAIVPLRSLASNTGDRVLQVQRRGQSTSLFVEWRQPVGFDSVLNNYPSLINGVNVYLGSNTNLRSQAIVDYGYTTTHARDAGVPMENVLLDFAGDVLILPLFEYAGERWILVYYGLS